MSFSDIVILVLAVTLALVVGWRTGARRGAHRSLQLIVSALAIKLDDEFPKFISELALVFKEKREEVQAGAKLVEGFLE